MKHFSVLYSSNERQVTDPLLLSLSIKLKDTRTYVGGLQTIHSLYNGVEKITNHPYEVVPYYFKKHLIDFIRKDCGEFNEFSDICNNKLNDEEIIKKAIDQKLGNLWNSNLDGHFRSNLFVKLAQIPWSDEIRKGIKGTKLSSIGKANSNLPQFEYTSNFAGEKKNMMFSPKSSIAQELINKKINKAFEEYQDSITPSYPESKIIVGGSKNRILTKDDIIKSYVDAISTWHTRAYTNFMPIVGGLSGTTLRTLNIYQAALTELKDKGRNDLLNEALPLTRLRFLMLWFLVGANKHHSYDEVYSQSHAMPDPTATLHPNSKVYTTNGKIIYHPVNYADVFLDNNKISNMAKQKKLRFIREPNDKAEESVIGTLNRLIKKCLPNKQNLIIELREATVNYVNKNFLARRKIDSNSEESLKQVVRDISAQLEIMKECLKK